jgi:hypothetical protein
MKNIIKHFTILNILTGILSITFITIVKFSGLAHIILDFLNLNPNELREYILTGFFGLIFRLGIRGLLEGFINELDFTPNVLTINGPDQPNPNVSIMDRPNQPNPQNIRYPPTVPTEPNNPDLNREDLPGNRSFTIDPTTNKYKINDPTNIGNRGYINTLSGDPHLIQQPYMSNFADALEHLAGGRGEIDNISFDPSRFGPGECLY